MRACPQRARGVLRPHKCETVLHTAGIIGGKVDQMMYSALQINIQGTMNVAEAVRLTGAKRLVHVSTFGVYDMRRDAPKVLGEDFHRGQGRAYGNSKACKELILEAYRSRYGFELVGVRPANVFGNGHFWSGSGGGEKVHEMMVAGREGRAAKIASNQVMPNEYIYSKDIGGILDAAATAPQTDRLFFNAGSGVLTTHDELVAAVRKVHPDFQWEVMEGRPPGKARDCVLDLSEAKAKLGWEPQYTLDAALADYAEEIAAVGAF
jgi:UDP-glucose 4-epimerase